MMINDDPLMAKSLGMRLGVSTNYLMHGFIWNYPDRFAGLCQKAPLKSLGSHPVDVFASLEAHSVPTKQVLAGIPAVFVSNHLKK